MSDSRLSPDEALAQARETSSPRGLLKVFLGYAAGVGKSFAMLQAANAALVQGRDLLVGWIEPHPRPDTLLLLAGMQSIPVLQIRTDTLTLSELDLDACLVRRPEVLLVDELAHTNAPGCRHRKRWQDVEELLDAGIEVWTTVNIQHFESMNDIVSRVTGVKVHETVPDALLDRAAEVEVVDVDPEDLMDRLRQGKIYQEAQARRALESFFRKENLLALRELTLRRVADRVGRQVDLARERSRTQAIWPVRERLMVSVGPSPLSEDLLRQAARLARTLNAELLAVTIETPAHRLQDPRTQERLSRNLSVAESLGAETVILQGEEVAQDLLAYARRRNVTKLVVGKNRDRGWLRRWRRTIGDELLRSSGDIDVYVLSGRTPPQDPPRGARPWTFAWNHFAWSAALLAGFTGLALLFGRWGMAEANIVLTLLMSVVVTAAWFGLGPSVFTAVLAVLVFNFFFTQPLYSLTVDEPQYYLVFLFLLVVGTVIGSLTDRLRRGVLTSRAREQRLETINRMHRELSGRVGREEVVVTGELFLGELLEGPVWIVAPEEGGWPGRLGLSASETALLDWAWSHRQRAGHGTSTLFDHPWSVWPLEGAQALRGLLVLPRSAADPELVDSLAALLGAALDRAALVEDQRRQAAAVETERSRASLLQSLSHDLKTPLTIIRGQAEALKAAYGVALGPRGQAQLSSLETEVLALNHQVENILELSRFTEGHSWTLSPCPAEEPVLGAAERFRGLYPEVPLTVAVPQEVLVAPLEPVLIQQALQNLLENAVEHAGGVGLEIRVIGADTIRYSVADRGPGVVAEEREAIFQKFVRGKQTQSRGSGLGLAIVAEVARVHGGRTWVEAREGGGAVFCLEVPR